MKQLFYITAILALIASCQMRPNGEKLVLNYLRDSTDGMEYSIVDISTPDSLYSPFESINSLLLTKSSIYANLTKQLLGVYDMPSLKERRVAASEVAKLADAEYNNQEEFDVIVMALLHPTLVERPANRIAYTVTYKVDGKIKEDVFYLERDGRAVGHTASELQKQYLKLCEVNGNIFQLKMDAEETVKTIR